jgi:hypothetical protein
MLDAGFWKLDAEILNSDWRPAAFESIVSLSLSKAIREVWFRQAQPDKFLLKASRGK